MSRVLVFPTGMAEAGAYASYARQTGKVLIGASSLPDDSIKGEYESHIYLPYVHQENFEDLLLQAIASFNITEIYSPHAVINQWLIKNIPLLAPGISVVERLRPRPPIDLPFDWYDTLATSFTLDESKLLSQAELTAILTRAMAMRGESSTRKLVAIVAVSGLAPPGDIVEIGALAGRSAFVLGWIGRRFGIGPVLVLDPWSRAMAMQYDAPEVLRQTTENLNFDLFFKEFLENLIPCFYSTLNYSRVSAQEARASYSRGFEVSSLEFGRTSYQGTISLLHIDGNHDFEAVTRDIQDWCMLVEPGGWIIVDDYVWSFGDGPRRAGDRFLESYAIDCAFVCDGALFARMGSV